jgi:hypothetical protein
MLKQIAFVTSAGLVLSLGVVSLAAPPQADRPGVVVQPKVTVVNRGRSEAIPVSVQGWDAGEKPLTVQLAGTASVQARLLSQPWSYRTVKVAPGQDIASALATAGVEGWEAAGVQTSDSSGIVLLLKKPL